MDVSNVISVLAIVIAILAAVIASLQAYQNYMLSKRNQPLNLKIEDVPIDNNVLSMSSVNTEGNLSLIEFAIKINKDRSSGEIRDVSVINANKDPDDIRFLYLSEIHAEKPYAYTFKSGDDLSFKELSNVNLEDSHVEYVFTDGNIIYLQERNDIVQVCIKIKSEGFKKYYFAFRGYAKDVEIFVVLVHPSKDKYTLLKKTDICNYDVMDNLFETFGFSSTEDMITELSKDISIVEDYLE